MTFFGRAWVVSLTFAVIFQSFGSTIKVTSVNTYSLANQELPHNGQSARSSHQIFSFHNKSSLGERKRTTGNVIFDDSPTFSSSYISKDTDGSKRKKSISEETKQRAAADYDSRLLAGGFLQNHRLEGEPEPVLASTDVASAAAAAVYSDLHSGHSGHVQSKYFNDQSNVHQGSVGAAGIIESVSGGGGLGRSFIPEKHGHGHHGWASNPGSCLFSCSGGAVSCCQLNYVQCCPNPHQETFNFKNLHHGRGYGYGGASLGKFGYGGGGGGWGAAQPFPLPTPVRSKPCQPYHPGYISQPILPRPDHVGAGIGLGAGGNGAAGYYFHKRSDIGDDTVLVEGSSKKARLRRGIAKTFDHHHHVQPCPVYSAPPSFGGWPKPPPSVGLGSLIGWSKPGNHIQPAYLGGGAYFGGGGAYGYGGSGGWGWGRGSSHCKWDYECPGVQKCCKGICQLTPYK